MDAGVATLLAGLTSGMIAGSIGVISAVLSYRMAHRQIERQEREAHQSRRFEVAAQALPKRIQSAETVWRLLFSIEQHRSLRDTQVDDFICAVMWLPPHLREACLHLLQLLHRQTTGSSGAEELAKACTKIREDLIVLTGIQEIENLTNREVTQ